MRLNFSEQYKSLIARQSIFRTESIEISLTALFQYKNIGWADILDVLNAPRGWGRGRPRVQGRFRYQNIDALRWFATQESDVTAHTKWLSIWLCVVIVFTAIMNQEPELVHDDSLSTKVYEWINLTVRPNNLIVDWVANGVPEPIPLLAVKMCYRTCPL